MVKFSRGLIFVIGGGFIASSPIVLFDEWDTRTVVVTLVGVLFSIIGGILQERDSRPFTWNFEEDDWLTNEGRFRLNILQSKHRKGRNAMVKTYSMRRPGIIVDCFCNLSQNEKGDIEIMIATQPFKGRAIVL